MRAKRTVLIVEDEWLIADFLQHVLEEAGYEVRGPVARVAQALELIEREQPDAGVLDVSLREESSVQVARALAQRSVPFVFMTGYVAKDLPADLRNRPILSKPVDTPRLVSCIGVLIANGGVASQP